MAFVTIDGTDYEDFAAAIEAVREAWSAWKRAERQREAEAAAASLPRLSASDDDAR